MAEQNATLVDLTRNYVGQSASAMGLWLGMESVESISAHILYAVTQGIVKAFKANADKGQCANPTMQI